MPIILNILKPLMLSNHRLGSEACDPNVYTTLLNCYHSILICVNVGNRLLKLDISETVRLYRVNTVSNIVFKSDFIFAV